MLRNDTQGRPRDRQVDVRPGGRRHWGGGRPAACRRRSLKCVLKELPWTWTVPPQSSTRGSLPRPCPAIGHNKKCYFLATRVLSIFPPIRT